jgi:hypothetical protein
MLGLPTAGAYLLSDDEAALALCHSYTQGRRFAPIRIIDSKALLMKKGTNVSLAFSVQGLFTYEDVSINPQRVERTCRYDLVAEGRKNWVAWKPPRHIEGFQAFQKRLDAAQVLRFMQALRADVMKYVAELRNEKSLIQGGISSLLQEVTQFFEKAE